MSTGDPLEQKSALREQFEKAVKEAMKPELDAMWEHIRNLERKLLNPTEYEIYY